MAFVKNEDKANMSVKDQNSYWFSLLMIGEKVFMFLVGVLVYMYLIFWVWSISFPPELFLLAWLIKITGVVIGAAAIAFLLHLERVAMIEFIEAIGTAGIKDDIWKGAISVILVIGFYIVEKEGSAKFLNTIDGYDPKVITDHNQDKRVSSNTSTRINLEKEKKDKIKSVICVECKNISANYAAKISEQRRKLKSVKSTHTENDKKYIDSQNKGVNKRISDLEDERDAELEKANARFEMKKDSIVNSYENRINRIDTMVLSLKSSIDSNNAVEIRKGEEVTQSNNKRGGYISLACMFFLIFNRFLLVRYFRKAGMSWASIGEFMKAATVLSEMFAPINIFFAELSEKRKISNSVRYANVFASLENYTEKKTGGDERAKLFVNEKVSNMESAQLFYKSLFAPAKMNFDSDESDKKISEKSAEIFEKDSENPIILPTETAENDEIQDIQNIITSHESMLFRCENSERDDIMNIIESHKSILTRLKNI